MSIPFLNQKKKKKKRKEKEKTPSQKKCQFLLYIDKNIGIIVILIFFSSFSYFISSQNTPTNLKPPNSSLIFYQPNILYNKFTMKINK